jgi:HAD superfamily 5'-nucleotidase-like hydrolase
MDYTLVHYHTEHWERRCFEHVKERLLERGWPVQDVSFDPDAMTLGLVMDLQLGNIVKANRFGFVKRAQHGSSTLGFEEQRRLYAREIVDLSEPRWVFINTLFGLSEASFYAQIVDLMDQGALPQLQGYERAYHELRSILNRTHMEGRLKAEIIADPQRYVQTDPAIGRTLEDLKASGKRLLLITNSEWFYTREMMRIAVDPFLEHHESWREVFDIVIVGARKPSFFSQSNPSFRVVDDALGHLEPNLGSLEGGQAYLGGNARQVEEALSLTGEEILYVGDHIFADVHVSKAMLRWRTALVVRELEAELQALETFKPEQEKLTRMMHEKENLEDAFSQLRIEMTRLDWARAADDDSPKERIRVLKREMKKLRERLLALDANIAPIARAHGKLGNDRWGLLFRAGNDKSHLARQIERYADIYTSRVSNFLLETPFVYLRSPRGSLPHDSGPSGGT